MLNINKNNRELGYLTDFTYIDLNGGMFDPYSSRSRVCLKTNQLTETCNLRNSSLKYVLLQQLNKLKNNN